MTRPKMPSSRELLFPCTEVRTDGLLVEYAAP